MKRKEKMQEGNEESVFALARCVRDESGSIKCIDDQVLLNDALLEFDASDQMLFITDNTGEVIHEINRRTPKDPSVRVNKVKIDYINGHNIIFTTFNDRGYAIQSTYIKQYPNNTFKRTLFDCRKRAKLIGIDIPNSNISTVIIKYNESSPAKEEAKLFSCERGKFISPTFSKMALVDTDNNNILRFEDYVYSNKKVDGRRETTTLIGFITLDGILANTVYDSGIEKTREIGIKAGNLTEGYKRFRNILKKELDYQFEVEKQLEARRKKFEEKSISQLILRKTRNN